MFCKWCGNKITNNGKPCPICNKEQDALENGNGFWDLCEDENSLDHSDSLKGNDKKDKNLLLTRIVLFFVVLSLIPIFITLVQIKKSSKELTSIQSEISGLYTTISNEKEEFEEYISTTLNSIEDSKSHQNESDKVTLDNWEMVLAMEDININHDELSIESHEIESSYGNKVLIVTGKSVEKDNVEVIWQEYDEEADEWITFAEQQLTILINEKDGPNQIRAVCISQNNFNQDTIYIANYPSNENNDDESSPQDQSLETKEN